MNQSFGSGQRNEILLKKQCLKKNYAVRKTQSKMTPPLVFRVFRAARYHELYR